MGSGTVAAVGALLALAFVELVGANYPSKTTWRRLRTTRGREAVRKMRERFEDASTRRTPRNLALVLLVLVGVWAVVATRWLGRDWIDVVLDSLSSIFVCIALLRIPHTLREVGARMREYEKSAGEDPDADISGDGGPAALAL